jgi:RES domain-containing protein
MADARHKIFDRTGAMIRGGRWNSTGLGVIYAAETFSGALLEVLVHSNLSQPPKNHRVVRIVIPEEVKMETLSAGKLPGWDAENLIASRAFGDRWITEKRSAVLKVPSVITKERESNLLINPSHTQFALIVPSEPEAIDWDTRLFRGLTK